MIFTGESQSVILMYKDKQEGTFHEKGTHRLGMGIIGEL